MRRTRLNKQAVQDSVYLCKSLVIRMFDDLNETLRSRPELLLIRILVLRDLLWEFFSLKANVGVEALRNGGSKLFRVWIREKIVVSIRVNTGIDVMLFK